MIRRFTTFAVAALLALAPAGPAAATSDEDDGLLLGMSMVLGGTYGGITYDALWGGRAELRFYTGQPAAQPHPRNRGGG